jgi:hypothetical protein
MIKILELLAEGGSLAVLGRQVDDTWRYVMIADGPALAAQAGSARETPLATWEEVLEKLEGYEWRKWRMRFLHPDFAKRVEAARRAGTVH